jgi:hypothetical protein
LAKQTFSRIKGCFILGTEGSVGAKRDLASTVRPPLRDGQYKGVSGDEVPGISRQPSGNAVRKPRGAVYPERPFLVEEGAQQGVKSDQMIDMGMGNEYFTNLEQLPGREVVQVAAVEKQGFTAMGEADIKTRVAERTVNESGVEDRPHVRRLPEKRHGRKEFRWKFPGRL